MKGDEDTKFMVSQTIKYSDGTETTTHFVENPDV